MTDRQPTSAAALRAALRDLEREVMPLPEVTGVALGESGGRPCLRVYVAELTPEVRSRIATEYKNVPVKVEVSGRFEAQ